MHSSASPRLSPLWVVGYDLQSRFILGSLPNPPTPASTYTPPWHCWCDPLSPTLRHWIDFDLSRLKRDTPGWVSCSNWNDFFVLNGPRQHLGLATASPWIFSWYFKMMRNTFGPLAVAIHAFFRTDERHVQGHTHSHTHAHTNTPSFYRGGMKFRI